MDRETHALEAFLRFLGLTGSDPASAPVSEGGGPGVGADGPGAGAEAGVVTDGPACCCWGDGWLEGWAEGVIA